MRSDQEREYGSPLFAKYVADTITLLFCIVVNSSPMTTDSFRSCVCALTLKWCVEYRGQAVFSRAPFVTQRARSPLS